MGIPVAALTDRADQRQILAVALAAWSAMTALRALAHDRLQLTLPRFGVGIGEAGGTPPSTSILADKLRPALRPMALTIFASAPVSAAGSALRWRAPLRSVAAGGRHFWCWGFPGWCFR